MKGIERGKGWRGEKDREVKGIERGKGYRGAEIERVKDAQSKILVKSPKPRD